MPPKKIGTGKYTLLGEGGYGSTISPALPNENSTGAAIEFPGMVTKVMYNDGEFKKALEADRTIAEKIPMMAVGFTPYRKKYTLANIKNKNANLEAFLRQPRRAGGRNFFLARMPYLGDNCNTIYRDPALQAELAKVPPQVLCGEVLKLLRTVKQTYDSGYIHADIRELNVLCDVKTGRMTIIDFDWLMSIEEYREKYPSFFYSHPSEEMFLRGFLHRQTGLLTDRRDPFSAPAKSKLLQSLMRNAGDYSAFNQLWDYAVENNYEGNLYQMSWANLNDDMYEKYKTGVHNMLHELWTRVKGNPANARDAIEELERGYSLPTVDTYGLGTALFELFWKSIPKRTPFRTFLMTKLLPGLIMSNAYRRLNADAAIAATEEFMRDSGWGVPSLPRALSSISSISPRSETFAISSSPGVAGGGGNHVTVSLSSSSTSSNRRTRSSNISSNRKTRISGRTSSGNSSILRMARVARGLPGTPSPEQEAEQFVQPNAGIPSAIRNIIERAKAEQEAGRYVPKS